MGRLLEIGVREEVAIRVVQSSASAFSLSTIFVLGKQLNSFGRVSVLCLLLITHHAVPGEPIFIPLPQTAPMFILLLLCQRFEQLEWQFRFCGWRLLREDFGVDFYCFEAGFGVL